MLKRIYLEISNICNLQCSFCPVVEKDKKIMVPADFFKILTQAAPLAEEICLHLMGEPLAHPKFLEILTICEQKNVKIQLTTNGILLKRYHRELLKSPSLRQINFSLQAFKDNFPDKKMEDYLLSLLDFSKEAQNVRPDLYINLRLWNQESEKSDNEEVYQMIEKYFNIRINRTVDVGGIKSKRIWNKLYLHFDSRFDWPSFDLPFQGTKGRCNGVLGHIGIHADGTVVPCCLDKEAVINLGNCLNEPLSSILQNERINSMRDGFNRGVLVETLCQHCTYINRFKK